MKKTKLLNALKVNGGKGISIFILMILLCLQGKPGICQEPPPDEGTGPRPFGMSGRLGLTSEAYTVNGIEGRRPPGMGQVNLSTNFNLLGLQSGINLLYNTDDNQLRQSMNQFHFHGTWRWLTLSAGTVSPRFSKYSLSGVTVTGGLVEINPGWFSLSLTGGRSQRAVSFSDEPGFREPAFERWLYAGRMGFGKKGRTEFAITGLYAYDVIESIDETGEMLPSENLSLTPELRLSFMDGSFILESNVTVSAFTRDRNSEDLDLGDTEIPELISDQYTPKRSSRMDYAGEISGQFSAGPLRLNGLYERIQPGFRSMGLGQIRSDQELYRFRSQLRMFKGRANLSATFSQGQNNLLETRISTMNRQQIGSNLMLRLSQTMNLMFSYMRLTNENSPVDPDHPAAEGLHQKQISQNFMLTPTFVIVSESISHTISLTGAYQVLDDESLMVSIGDREPVGFTNYTAGTAYGISLPSGLSFNISGNFLHNESRQTSASGHSLNVSSGYAFFEKKLNLNLSLGWARNGIEFTRILDEDEVAGSLMQGYVRKNYPNKNNGFLEGEYVVRQYSHQYTLNLSTTYRLPNGNPIRLNIRGLTSIPGQEDGREFNEWHAVLRYDHRF